MTESTPDETPDTREIRSAETRAAEVPPVETPAAEAPPAPAAPVGPPPYVQAPVRPRWYTRRVSPLFAGAALLLGIVIGACAIGGVFALHDWAGHGRQGGHYQRRDFDPGFSGRNAQQGPGFNRGGYGRPRGGINQVPMPLPSGSAVPQPR